jgi:hypothetical protein
MWHISFRCPLILTLSSRGRVDIREVAQWELLLNYQVPKKELRSQF